MLEHVGRESGVYRARIQRHRRTSGDKKVHAIRVDVSFSSGNHSGGHIDGGHVLEILAQGFRHPASAAANLQALPVVTPVPIPRFTKLQPVRTTDSIKLPSVPGIPA